MLLNSQGNQVAQPAIAQEQPSPEQRAQDDRKQDRKRATLDAHVGGDGTAQITGQQDRAEHGGARYCVEDCAAEQDDPQPTRTLSGYPS